MDRLLGGTRLLLSQQNVSYLISHCHSVTDSFSLIIPIFTAVGRALALDGRALVYGGGSKGIMGIVSGSVLENDGKVIGVIPRAMVAGGGENEKVTSSQIYLDEVGREMVPDVFFKTHFGIS